MFKYFWKKFGDTYSATCEFFDENNIYFNSMCYFLMDDGGVSIESSKSWFKDCINLIKEVKENKGCSFMERETFGVELNFDDVEIYSLLSDDTLAVLPLHDFEKILISWLNFLDENNPDSEVIVNF